MTYTFSHSSDDVFEAMEKFARLQREYEEEKLAEIITKYDFIVGSKENHERLKEILPEGANIVYSRFIENPTTIYAVKKFDVMDYVLPEGREQDGRN